MLTQVADEKDEKVIWRGRRLDRAPAASRPDRESLLREVSIENSAELRSAPPELLHHTRYYIQSPYTPWPSFLVADAHPHLAMTSLLLRPSLSVRFCAVAAPPFWRLVPGLFHPLCPNVLIRWILPRVSARCDGNSYVSSSSALKLKGWKKCRRRSGCVTCHPPAQGVPPPAVRF